MKRIFLHAGLDKTGTTSIQAIARGNHKNLKALNAYYPPVGAHYGNTSGGLHSIPMEIIRSCEEGSASSSSLERLLRKFEASSVETLFLSSERCSIFGEEELLYLVNRLKDYEVVPIFVVRHPVAHRISQMASRGNIRKRRVEAFFQSASSWRCGSKTVLWRKHFPQTIILKYEDHADMAEPVFNLVTNGHASSLSPVARRRESLPVDLAMLNLELRAMFSIDDDLYRAHIYNHLFTLQDSDEYREFRPDPKQKLLPINEALQTSFIDANRSEVATLSATIEKSCDDYLSPIEGHFVRRAEIKELETMFVRKFLPRSEPVEL